MTDESPERDQNDNNVTVRYWASARAAAGIAEESVTAATLADLVNEVKTRHANSDRFADVIDSCSILVGETPVGSRDHAEIELGVGATVEFLPPFAGG